MIHQFPFQIYNMAWDGVNEVLYCTGKQGAIYEWLVKTDSEREMHDEKGHDGMVSKMLIISKLQLLATGGYDGQLLLWDTVSQGVKCRYNQHRRGICSMTFHEQLVLLFTSGLDHKICVWNPYITSLIHKIENVLNVIELQIIPNTNYLLALDEGGNVKARELNKFTVLSGFTIFNSEDEGSQPNKLSRGDKETEYIITMCSTKDQKMCYYFATDRIVGYEYN